jgi:hypothetical protein
MTWMLPPCAVCLPDHHRSTRRSERSAGRSDPAPSSGRCGSASRPPSHAYGRRRGRPAARRGARVRRRPGRRCPRADTGRPSSGRSG